jgi:nucleoprotein TPR
MELVGKTERLQAIQEDLAAAHREQMELTRQLEVSRTEFENDKRMLEATIADLSTVEDRAMSTQASV